MANLVCVEYVPTNDEITLRGESPLSGLVGETLDTYLDERHPNAVIPVRFPLVGANSHSSLLHKGRDVTDPYTLHLEGEQVPRGSVYLLKKKVPVSLYERTTDSSVRSLFRRPVYHSIYKLSDLKDFVRANSKSLMYSWIWRLEKNFTPDGYKDKYKHIFIEARVYGIDTVIGMYSGSNKHQGLAIQIIFRPQPSEKLRKQGIHVMRTCTNTYLMANSKEYIEAVDGTVLSREKCESNWCDKYDQFITPKQITAVGRFTEHRAQVLEELKKLEKSGSKKSEKVVSSKGSKSKGDTPPSKKSRKAYEAPVIKGNEVVIAPPDVSFTDTRTGGSTRKTSAKSMAQTIKNMTAAMKSTGSNPGNPAGQIAINFNTNNNTSGEQ